MGESTNTVEKYEIRKINPINLCDFNRVAGIIYLFGKDMATKYDIHHWDNSRIKTLAIVVLSSLKNSIYLVTDTTGMAIATFQISFKKNALHFEKLATSPLQSGKGVGSFCLNKIEEFADETNCAKIIMEVYTKSKHAIDFYLHRDFAVYGEESTLKYTEYKMEKQLT